VFRRLEICYVDCRKFALTEAEIDSAIGDFEFLVTLTFKIFITCSFNCKSFNITKILAVELKNQLY
jgi:hypothetical protein